MTAETVPAPKPSPDSLARVTRIARTLSPGETTVYWTGELGFDRTRDLQLHLNAAAWLTLNAQGVVALTQRAIVRPGSSLRLFEYRATRSTRAIR